MTNLSLLVLSLLVCGSVYFWYQRIIAFGNGQPLLMSRPQQQKPFGLVDVAIMFFASGLVQLVAIRVGKSFAGITGDFNVTQLTGDQQTTLMLSMGLGQLAAMIIAMGIISARYRKFLDLMGWQRQFVNQDFRIGVVAFLMVLPIVLGIQWLLSYLAEYDHETIRLFQENFSLRTALVSWFTAAVVAPIWEEVFFRGLVQGWLQQIASGPASRLDVKTVIGGWPDEYRLTRESPFPRDQFQPNFTEKITSAGRSDVQQPYFLYWMPIIFSSGLFALAHLGQGLAPIPLFVFGLALGYLYRRTGSLIPCITVHFLLNALTMFLLTLEMI